jgi:hypothetical protein
MRVKLLLVPIAASIALLAGCTGSPAPAPSPTPTTNGVEALTAEEILEAAAEALNDAPSVHVKGTIGEGEAGFGLDITYAGDDMEGSINFLGVEIEAVKIGTDLYVKAPADFWADMLAPFLTTPEQQALIPAASQMLAGTYGKAPAAAVTTVLDFPLEPGDLLGESFVTAPVAKGTVGELNGTQVITVTDGDDSVYSVAIEGEPYLLQILVGDEPVTFTVADSAPSISAPTSFCDVVVLATTGAC